MLSDDSAIQTLSAQTLSFSYDLILLLPVILSVPYRTDHIPITERICNTHLKTFIYLFLKLKKKKSEINVS